MKIVIPNELEKLNELFAEKNQKLYVVGGFVRDSLLLLNSEDIDLASSLTSQEVKALLFKTSFKVAQMSNKLGTCVITLNNKKFEYTAFRKDYYKKGGHHLPVKVNFVKKAKLDAMRRDFTINSLYYDISSGEVLDYFKGLKDIKKRRIKAIISPKYVFKSDGLRILRMIRFSLELNFSICKKTFKTAKKMSYQLEDISSERKIKEFMLILNADKKFGFKNSNYNKLTLFLLDLTIHLKEQTGISQTKLVTNILKGVKGISTKDINSIKNFISAYESLSFCTNNISARKFLQQYSKTIEKLLSLLYNEKDKKIYLLLLKNYNYMKKNNIPFTKEQLKINGNVLIKEFPDMPKNQISKTLNSVLLFCAKSKNNNNSKKILEFIKKQREKK